MILSASGWRKIFTEDKDSESSSKEIGNNNKILSYLIGETFAEYIKTAAGKTNPEVVIGTDTRPTGAEIARVILNACSCNNLKCIYLGYAAAPEIMSYAKNFDGFIYISASHNPIGHNGIKFGLSNGGVLEGSEARKVIESFKAKCRNITEEDQNKLLEKLSGIPAVGAAKYYKKQSLKSYEKFIRHVITGCEKPAAQKVILNEIKKSVKKNKISIFCDMNGSARAASIDKKFLSSLKIELRAFNDVPGNIVHAIIPEPENLIHCANRMQEAHGLNPDDTGILGYMPDCDGDRGNIVYWNEKTKKAEPITAQEVFALCVMAELSFELWKNSSAKNLAVAVNCPTSMRINEIASCLGAEVFRAEVGEANVVNLAREKRNEGFNVRIFGEGSNGGNITYPSAVRDPVATIFAIIKLLSLRDTKYGHGLFHIWCQKSGQEAKYKDNFTLADILETLPVYTTTGVSEKRAVLQVKMEDKGKLKENFKAEFEKSFNEKVSEFNNYGIYSWKCFLTNGTKETEAGENWNNGNGGLKVLFYDKEQKPFAFIWMRPSGTEPVFRVMCDVKGNNPDLEKKLLSWETEILQRADK